MIEKARKLKAGLCFAFVMLTCFLCQLSVSAAQTLLSEIEIKNTGNVYDITLQVDNGMNITRKVISDDKIVLTLPSTTTVEHVPVIFDGENNIDDIVVQNKKNSVDIVLQGDKINTSNIFFKETNSGLLKQAYSLSDKKFLNNSIISILDVKFCIVFVISLSFLLLIFSFVKPQKKSKSGSISHIKKVGNTKTQTMATIRKHSQSQKKANAPYIHYSIAANGHSIPEDFKVSGNTYREEKIRKYG